MQVANKIIGVPGAGSGIGRELAIQLLKKGAKVAVHFIVKQMSSFSS